MPWVDESDPSLAMAEANGRSLRRLDKLCTRDPSGAESVYHAGKDVELVSWVDSVGSIERQELIFAGLVVHFQRGANLRTGRVRHTDGQTGRPNAAIIDLQQRPSLRTLRLAALLLRAASRDFYTQHLLAQTNHELTRFQSPQTEVVALHRWRARLRRASRKITKRSKARSVSVFVVTGLTIGALLATALLFALRL